MTRPLPLFRNPPWLAGVAGAALLCGCASFGPKQPGDDLILQAVNSSCTRPVILRHDDFQASREIGGSAIAYDYRRARIVGLGYRVLNDERSSEEERDPDGPEFRKVSFDLASGPPPDAPVVTDPQCRDKTVSVYFVRALDRQRTQPFFLYAKHMTTSQIAADPRYVCAPLTQAIYQPPLKLGGAGRVIHIPNGEICRDLERSARD